MNEGAWENLTDTVIEDRTLEESDPVIAPPLENHWY